MGAQEVFEQAQLCGHEPAAAEVPEDHKGIVLDTGEEVHKEDAYTDAQGAVLDLNVIQPTHIRTEKGYGLGYRLNPKVKEIVKSVQKFSRTIENVRSV